MALMGCSRLYQLIVIRSNWRLSLLNMLNATRFFHISDVYDGPPREERLWYLEPALREWYPELREGWRLFEEDVLAIRACAEEHGADFIAYAAPQHLSVNPYSWTWSIRQSTCPKLYEEGKMMRTVHQFFQRESIPCVRVDEAMRSCPDTASLYYQYDGHFTPAGAEFVALQIAEHLQREYFPNRGLSPVLEESVEAASNSKPGKPPV